MLAVSGTIVMQVAAVYWPPLQQLLHTVPLTLADWGVLALVAAPIFVVPEIAKMVRRR